MGSVISDGSTQFPRGSGEAEQQPLLSFAPLGAEHDLSAEFGGVQQSDRGRICAFYGPASDLWKVYDNAFEACTFFSSSRPDHQWLQRLHQLRAPTGLNPTNDQRPRADQLGAIGIPRDFYQPTNSALINTGSLTSAASGGLYHYTIPPPRDQVERNQLNFGHRLHYVAVSSALPVDTDGDRGRLLRGTPTARAFRDDDPTSGLTNFLYTTVGFSGSVLIRIIGLGARTRWCGWAESLHGRLNVAVAVYRKVWWMPNWPTQT